MTLEVILAGFIVGIMIGISGMGGGSLITPMMIFVLNVPPLTAVGTDLLLGAITKTVGATQHYRLGNVDLKVIKTLLTGSIPGAISGLLFLRILPHINFYSVDKLIKQLLGVILLLVAVGLLYPSIWEHIEKLKNSKSESTQKRIVQIFSYVVGFFVAITSIGSGSLFVPFLLTFYPTSITQVVGTDVFHGAILSLVASSGHIVNGDINFLLLTNLMIGSLPGVVLGAKLNNLLPKRLIQLLLAFMLTVSGLKLL
ncbi:MAG: sulfite exporter TauE/SafE family protein [Acidobacteria bacterium]|nr:sulfite exporter TauE/SafE family protein [Acidobacteriota bacterium]